MPQKSLSAAAKPTVHFPIVGVGASAGGFDALRRLLQAMPAKSNVALVIVQHLAPDKPSLAPELLAKFTSMEVRQVHDEPVVLPNHVYVIPPGMFLSIVDGRLRLAKMEGPRATPVTIDSFLRSLAKDQQQRAVGVILSGTGSDGTLGIKAIKQAGGLVLAQDLDSAEHNGMPKSAIDTGLVDQVLSPEDIPRVLVQFAEHAYIRDEPPEQPASADPDQEEQGLSVEGLADVVAALRRQGNRDFRSYKEPTLLRRTRRRMCLHHIDNLKDYLQFLQTHPSEAQALAKDLLISVTDFFRDTPAWKQLSRIAITDIVQQKKNDDSVRVWVPGCATGEEAYSVAMLVIEELQRQQKMCVVQVFASDIDRDAINFARMGRYPVSIAVDVSALRLKRFFTMLDGDSHYQINKSLRDTVVFADQNLIEDPPFSHLDLICCRNVLIYLKPEVQQKVIALFHFALRQQGYLFLGTSETVGRQEDLFETLSKRWRIYRGIGRTRHERVDLPVSTGVRSLAVEVLPPPPRRDLRMTQLVQQKLLEMTSLCGVLIDRHWRILFINGNVDPYLTHKPGVPSDDLLNKARGGLRSRLRGAVHKAFSEQIDVTAHCRMEQGAGWRDVEVEVRLIHDSDREEDFALLVFRGAGDDELPLLEPVSGTPVDDTLTPSRKVLGSEIDNDAIFRQLEEELAATKEDLQTTIEQFEASHEEFKASNEEVMSINEELQSTNEELETSKEELQSLNEELSTVNLQLATKVDELECKHADLENLISATEVATICLNPDLTIRWFTPAAQTLVRIKPADCGRPLEDLSNDFSDHDLKSACQQVLQDLVPLDAEVECRDGRVFLRRIVPYRTANHQVGGVVITLVDISVQRGREQQLQASKEQLGQVNQTLEDQINLRTELLEILQFITRISNEARSSEEAQKMALEKITQYNGWQVGHIWQRTSDSESQMESAGVWHVVQPLRADLSRLEAFQRLAEETRVASGEGLIGKVLETGQPQWLGEAMLRSDTWRNYVPDIGLYAAAAFPIIVEGQVIAVMEFFSCEQQGVPERFLEIMPDIGIQLGHVIQRKRLEKIVVDISTQERRRIGRELHDGVSQQLTGGALIAESLRQRLLGEPSEALDNATHLVEIFKATHQDVRKLSSGLLPSTIDPAELTANLQSLALEVHAHFDLECTLDSEQFDPSFVQNDSAAFVILQIAREAVHNAVKHAHAQRIQIVISSQQDFQLIVRDNGQGFDTRQPRTMTNGLQFMSYRAHSLRGTFDVQSTVRQGTEVLLTLPAKACQP